MAPPPAGRRPTRKRGMTASLEASCSVVMLHPIPVRAERITAFGQDFRAGSPITRSRLWRPRVCGQTSRTSRSVAVRLLADRTRLTQHLSATLTCCSFTPRYYRGPALVDVATMLAGGAEARVLLGCGQMSSEPRGTAVRLVLGAERLR